MQSISPKVIRRTDPSRVVIEWSDGRSSVYTPAHLRRLCPCAQCVNETTGVRMLDPRQVPEDLRQADLALVGNYAITLRFSDGHHTGIYTFEYLRENDPGEGSGGTSERS
jgi:DUF971 family protein